MNLHAATQIRDLLCMFALFTWPRRYAACNGAAAQQQQPCSQQRCAWQQVHAKRDASPAQQGKGRLAKGGATG